MILRTLARTFDWSGTASRKEVWVFLAFTTGAAVAAGLIECLLVSLPPVTLTGPLTPFVVIGLLLPTVIGLQIRRLHDAGQSGLWILCSGVPLVSLLLLAFLLLAPSRTGPSRPDRSVVLVRLAQTVVLLAGLLTASRLFWAPYSIQAGSMKPTLMVGDYVAVGRTPGFEPERGDIVVFRSPAMELDYVKRVIGLPGDTVQLTDGTVYINSRAVPRTPVGMFEEVKEPQGPRQAIPNCANDPVGLGDICRSEMFVETLPNGVAHPVLNLIDGAGVLDTTPLYNVPAGHYFVMGDNRDNALDSRVPAAAGGIGFVPADHVIGRVHRVIFSSAGRSLLFFWTWRSDRFLKTVQ